MQKKQEKEQTTEANFPTAVRWVGFSKYVTVASRLFVSLTMARLLAPEIYGVVEMAYTFYAFARAFQGFSIAEIIVQRKELDQELLSTLYWGNLTACCMASGILLLLSPLAGVFYSNELVGRVAAAYSVCFILEGMACVPRGLLERELNFRVLAISEILEVISMGLVGIALAVAGWGVWAVVGSTIAGTVVKNFVTSINCSFRPRLVFSYARLKTCVGFATHMSGVRFLGYLRQYFDKILIGVVLGAPALGIYGAAKKFVQLPHETITGVVNRAVFSKFASVQDDVDELQELYLRTLSAIATLSLPMFAMTAVLSKELIQSLLGQEWNQTIPLVRVLAFAAAINTLSTVRHRMLIARGMTGTLLKSNLVRLTVYSIAILSAVWWGMQSLVWAILLSNFAGWIFEYCIAFSSWAQDLWKKEISCLQPIVLCVSVAIVVGVVVKHALLQFESHQGVTIPITALLMAVSYFLVLRLFVPDALVDIAKVAPARYRRYFISLT
ncbi:lipopolysaccharide biosynthesis protein [Rosistilla oblonga]|uniref:lipopolysaccharide biosynthesis protein n=1 Tax=Rosistilla oblonga TaxID=2527990 RepID=UPI003A983C62